MMIGINHDDLAMAAHYIAEAMRDAELGANGLARNNAERAFRRLGDALGMDPILVEGSLDVCSDYAANQTEGPT